MRNLEIKAAVRSFEACRSGLRAQPEARRHAILRQTDWYFRVPRGRMKLREIVESGTRTAELIVYLRPDTRAARTSEFVRLPVAECAPTRRMLTDMFGLAVCVRKQRDVWLVENARIHMDRVTGIGTFVEIEVVVSRGARQAARLMAALREALGIRQRDVIGTSYADLVSTPAPRERPASWPGVHNQHK